MLLLQETQIEPCRVMRHNIFDEMVLNGVSYQDKLFFQVASYSLEREANARQTALQKLKETKENLLVLIVRCRTQWTVWQEDPELTPCSQERFQRLQIAQINLERLSQDLHLSRDFRIGDRRQGLKRYKSCFQGHDLLAWLQRHYQLTPEESQALAQRLIDEKLMYQLHHQETFTADHQLYRFYLDEL